MRIYADHPDRRTRQLVGDVLAIAALIAAVPAGRAIYGWLDQYGDAGQSLNDSSQALAGNLHDAADRMDGIPLIGGTVAEPLGDAGDSAASIAATGAGLRDFVSATAGITSVSASVLIVALALFGWFGPRLAWMKRAASATNAQRTSAGLDLLALRALTAAASHELDATAHLGGTGEALLTGWREGDPGAIHALATIELARLGLSPPPEPVAGLEVTDRPS